MVGTLFFLWFLGLVRKQLFSAESGCHRLSGVAYAGGVATAISLLLMPAVHATGAINNENLTLRRGAGLPGDQRRVFYAAELSAAVFLLALGLSPWRERHSRNGWAGPASSSPLWLAIPPIGWAALLLGFPIWLTAVSLLLATRSRSDSRLDLEHRTP